MSLKDFFNKVSGTDKIYYAEEIGRMNPEEFKANEPAIDYQMNKLGIPREADLAASDEVYVRSYTRDDGTKVRAYYRSKPGSARHTEIPEGNALKGKLEYNVNTTPWNSPFLPAISFNDYGNPLPDIYKNIYDIPLENGMKLGEKATDFTARIASNKMTISGANLQNAMRDFEYARENEHAYILNSRSEIKNEGLSKLMDKVGIPKNSRGVIYDNNSKQSKQLWNSPEIQEFITNNYLKLLNNKQDNAVEIEFKFNLINMDNFLGIQHCQLYNPHITSDGYFNGIVVDYYDFRYRTPAGIGDFPNNINNWGYSMQEKGFLENHFNIYVIHEKL